MGRWKNLEEHTEEDVKEDSTKNGENDAGVNAEDAKAQENTRKQNDVKTRNLWLCGKRSWIYVQKGANPYYTMEDQWKSPLRGG